MTVSSTDYAAVKASRSPEFTRQLSIHESSHCVVSRAQGNFVDLVSLIPNGTFAGYCMRRGASRHVSALSMRPHRRAKSRYRMIKLMIVDLCEKIGSPEVGEPRVDNAEGISRAMVNVVDLVAGRVGEKLFCPEREPIPAAQDFVEARAFASIICSSPSSVDAFLRFAEAEAEALLRAHAGVVTAIAKKLAEQGVLTSDQIDQIISDAVAAEMQAAEYERRREMQARAESASKFRGEMTSSNGLTKNSRGNYIATQRRWYGYPIKIDVSSSEG